MTETVILVSHNLAPALRGVFRSCLWELDARLHAGTLGAPARQRLADHLARSLPADGSRGAVTMAVFGARRLPEFRVFAMANIGFAAVDGLLVTRIGGSDGTRPLE